MSARKARRVKKGASSSRSRKTAQLKRGGQAPAQPDRRKAAQPTLRLRAVEPLFTVDDLARSVRFYTDILGFIVDEEYKDDKSQLQGVMLKAGACRLGLSQDDWKKGRDRQKGIAVRIWCVTAQDLDAVAARVRNAGYALAEEPRDQSWGGRSFAVDDPDGFHLTIYRR